MKNPPRIRNLVVVSDLHCGDRMGLCLPNRVRVDGGGWYVPSRVQRKVYGMWRYFWDEWVPHVTEGESYAVVCNGDCVEGDHHGSKTPISTNINDQAAIAKALLAPVVEACGGRFYVIRGTEAHVGKSAELEEELARDLGAIPDEEEGQHARWELWARLGGGLIHVKHHIGTSSSTAYEGSALNRELGEAFVEAGRWKDKPPDVVVRSHRHRDFEIRMPNESGYAICLCTAAWQLATPLSHRIASARQTQPQIGGVLIRAGEDELYTRHKVWRIKRPREVRL